MDLGLTGKTAIVTGASRGIGRFVVERLLAEGMQVAFCARSPEGVAEAAAELGQRVIGTAVDAEDAPRSSTTTSPVVATATGR